MKSMKNRFILSTSLIICFVLCLTTFASAAPESGAKSLRDFLVKSKNVTGVYPIDDFLTFVVPESSMIGSGINDDFDEELLKFCKTQGTLEGQFNAADPLTGKESNTWQAIKPDEKDKFTNPKSGNREEFSGDMLYKGITSKGSATPAPVRVKDYMEVVEIFKSGKTPKSFIVKTKEKQPFVYKIDSIPPYAKIVLPPDGDLVKNVSELKSSRKEGIIFKSKPTQKDADVFVYLLTICKKFNLTPRFLVNEGEFVPIAESNMKYLVNNTLQSGYFKIKLKEITSPLVMFKYMSDLGPEKNKFSIWYIWAAGDKKFVAKGTEERTVDDKGIMGSKFQIIFVNDRGMEGIEFTPADKK